MPTGVGGRFEPFGAPGTFFFSPKTLKNIFFQNSQQSQNSIFFMIFDPILVAFWIHFGVLLLEKFNAKTGNGKDQENHQKSCISEE